MVVVTVGEVLSMPFMNTYWTKRSSANNRGQYAALFTIAWAVGQIAGPFSGGAIADKYGFTTLWWTVGIVGLLSALGYASLYKKRSVAGQDQL